MSEPPGFAEVDPCGIAAESCGDGEGAGAAPFGCEAYEPRPSAESVSGSIDAAEGVAALAGGAIEPGAGKPGGSESIGDDPEGGTDCGIGAAGRPAF